MRNRPSETYYSQNLDRVRTESGAPRVPRPYLKTGARRDRKSDTEPQEPPFADELANARAVTGAVRINSALYCSPYRKSKLPPEEPTVVLSLAHMDDDEVKALWKCIRRWDRMPPVVEQQVAFLVEWGFTPEDARRLRGCRAEADSITVY